MSPRSKGYVSREASRHWQASRSHRGSLQAVDVLDASTGKPLQPPANAVFILTSESTPLFVLSRAAGGEGLRLRLPALRPISFVITSGTTETRITMEMGGVLLSSVAFGRHQFLRHQQYVVAPGRPIRVDSIDASMGVTVVAGAVALPDGPPTDPTRLPRYSVAGDGTVMLP
jgi:hypothetical protein